MINNERKWRENHTMKKRLMFLALAFIITLTLTTSSTMATKAPSKQTKQPITLANAANIFNAYLSNNFKIKKTGDTNNDGNPIFTEIINKKIFMLNNYPVLIFTYGTTNTSFSTQNSATTYVCNIQNGTVVNQLLKKSYGGAQIVSIDTKYDKTKSMLVIHSLDYITGSTAPFTNDNYYSFLNNKLSRVTSLCEEMVYGNTNPPTWKYTINDKKGTKSTYDLAIARYKAVPANAKGLDVYQSYLDKFFENVTDEKYAAVSDLDGDGKTELVAEKYISTNDSLCKATLSIFSPKYPKSQCVLTWKEPEDHTDGTYFYLSNKNYFISEINDGSGNYYVVYKYTSGKLNKVASYFYGVLSQPKTYSCNGKSITKAQWDSYTKKYGIDKVKTSLPGNENDKGVICYSSSNN